MLESLFQSRLCNTSFLVELKWYNLMFRIIGVIYVIDSAAVLSDLIYDRRKITMKYESNIFYARVTLIL